MSRLIFASNPTGRGLLRFLSEREFRCLLSKLETLELERGQVLQEPGRSLNHLYFPTSAVISMQCIMENGATAEMGLVGHDGVAGIALLLGEAASPCYSFVQFAGTAMRLSRADAQKEFSRGGELQFLLLRYTQALINQLAQTAVCSRLHSVRERLCRCLLLRHDLIRSDELMMTQEGLANVLGERRESVTVAAGHLQNSGLIHYSRGHIQILDRRGLEASSCECYRVVKSASSCLFAPLLSISDSHRPA